MVQCFCHICTDMTDIMEYGMHTASTTTLRVTEGGRIVIPAAIRNLLDLKVGARVTLTVQADRVILMNAKAARRRACHQVRRYVSADVSLSEELKAERKKEARRE